MAASSPEVDCVKSTLTSSTASSATVAALESLLTSETTAPVPKRAPPAVRGDLTATKAASVRNGKTTTARTRKVEPVTIHTDAPKALSGREKYALATDTVNICLKILTDSLRSQTKCQEPTLPPQGDARPSSTPPTSGDVTARSKRPLQPRSGNTTPAPSSPKSPNVVRGTSPVRTIANISGPSAHLTAAAQCASLGFAFLRNADTQALGVREMPKFQLETGMLAHIGKLIGHRLVDTAVRELGVVKRSLEATLSVQKVVRTVKAPRSAREDQSDKDRQAKLMQLNIRHDCTPEGLAIAIGYCQQVVKLISTTRDPKAVEAVAQHLTMEAPNGMIDLLRRQAKHTGDAVKVVKQLDALSNTVLGLCPSIASSADNVATDSASSPSPAAALKLQTLALRIRTLSWWIAKHQADVSKEILEPFLKCAAAFVRRQPDCGELLATCLESLSLSGVVVGSPILFNIQKLGYEQAERMGWHEQALHWTDEMYQHCMGLAPNDARQGAAVTYQCAVLLRRPPQGPFVLLPVITILEDQPTGNSEDYDTLLAALAKLIHVLNSQKCSYQYLPRLLKQAAGFAQRNARSYPGKNGQDLQTIVDAAVRSSSSTDDMLAWITDDAAKIYIRVGSLRAVAECAATRSMSEAWSMSSAAVSLNRMFRALLLRTVRAGFESPAATFFDSEQLKTDERGALLECQLKYVTDLALRIKYHEPLRKVIPELLRRLSKVYSVAEYPIRRARVTATIFGLREGYPELIPPHVFKVWHDNAPVDRTNLGKDLALQAYCSDVEARLAIARSFADGRPTVDDLKSKLIVWQRIIDGSDTREALCGEVDDPVALAQQLRSIVAYFGMLGEDAAALPVQQLLVKTQRLYDGESPAFLASTVGLARYYLHLGYSERASNILAQARDPLWQQNNITIEKLHYAVAYAEYFLALDDLGMCRQALDEARTLRSKLPPDKVHREQRRTYELLHAQGWLVQSQYSLQVGSPHEALAAAKRSVRVLNSIWYSLERANGSPIQEVIADTSEAAAADKEMCSLTKGVSKLQLMPKEAKTEQSKKGAAFWPIIPMLCKALTHLSDVYAHHGLFNEASYYSGRAIATAESVGSSVLFSRIESHRSRLLTLAERLEEAELCLAQDGALGSEAASLALIERLCAKAGVRVKEEALEEALALYERAVAPTDELASEVYLAKLEAVDGNQDSLGEQITALSLCGTHDNAVKSKTTGRRKAVDASREKAGRMISKPKSTVGVKKAKVTTTSNSMAKAVTEPCYLLAKLKTSLLFDQFLIGLRLGRSAEAPSNRNEDSRLLAMRQRQIWYHEMMHKAIVALEMDVTLNVLTESTLSFPSTLGADRRPSQPSATLDRLTSPAHSSTAAAKHLTKPTKKTVAVHAELPEKVLAAARDALLKGQTADTHLYSTAQTHAECSKISSATLLLSAISRPETRIGLHPVKIALAIDLPRVKALQYEQNAVAIDSKQNDGLESLLWPDICPEMSSETLTAAEFQERYIDIIPNSWTAVSLCLSDDLSELYVARYRSGQTPLVLKLPFARHKPDDLEQEAFDYRKGKAELKEIFELSNYTCHNPGSLEDKGAKSKWWSEREALDRRLHELLINIENIWFGGFKAIFSQHTQRADLLLRFRKSFDQILHRHLPSRKAAKGRTEGLALDDKVLDLFIGLGGDQDGTIDLDEPLEDLLCFVVDMLQFNGERNAYDEIDFDGMAVDTLDALRAYHEASVAEGDADQHLILVLDRRLQAVPWENLPCLDGASVSRVGSMLSLRECLLAMRATQHRPSTTGLPNNGEECHVVSRDSGAYILNPSSDLAATQTALEPALSNLAKADGALWTSIVNEVPSEDEFSSALQSKSLTLYFGHGAGSQYIRPRTIKRLSRCSEVIWLMGCSSGAVFECGELEPCAVPLAYLLAGRQDDTGPTASVEVGDGSGKCMSVVATLWDVTDKDIDRFSLAIGEEWGLWPAEEQQRLPAKTPKKRREIGAAPSTTVQVPNTPKTPKALKTPAPTKTPARNRSKPHRESGKKISLVQAVARSRDACYLRYLNGAAPVVYGVPVYLGD